MYFAGISPPSPHAEVVSDMVWIASRRTKARSARIRRYIRARLDNSGGLRSKASGREDSDSGCAKGECCSVHSFPRSLPFKVRMSFRPRLETHPKRLYRVKIFAGLDVVCRAMFRLRNRQVQGVMSVVVRIRLVGGPFVSPGSATRM